MQARTRFRINRFVPRDRWFHLARGVFDTPRPQPPHTHDFPEAFWVTKGSGTHHVNGQRCPLSRGDLVLVRPADTHAFSAARGGSLTFMNLAFRDDTRRFIAARYFEDAPTWPWADAGEVVHHRLDLAALAELHAAADRLAQRRQSRLAIEGFVLRMLEHLAPLDSDGRGDRAKPAWLLAAMREMDDPERLRRGPAAMAELCHRSVEHLNRVVREHFGCTTTELVNSLRLDRAARLLRLTDEPITAVAQDAGFDNLGYFYRRFNQRFDQTPRRYRLRATELVR